MKKKLLALVMAIACIVGTFSAVATVEQPITVEAATKKKAPSISKVYSAVKKAYGKNYLPTGRYSNKEILQYYGISSSWYSSVIAEYAENSAQVDELVIVKAKNADAKKKIKSALADYRRYQQEEAFQYPMNMPKVQAARIYVKGDYVCYICLGVIDQKIYRGDDDGKKVDAYKAENAKAVNAIKKLYK